VENIKINLDNLIAFLFVAKEKSFSAAAAKLFLTQPAVTTKIKCLEKQFGVKLFINTGKEMQLTETAKGVLPIAEELYKNAKEIEYTLFSFKDTKKGTLRIASSRSLSQAYLPPLVGIFSEHFPNIQISITEGPSHELVEKLAEFKYDVAILPKIPLSDKFAAHTVSIEKVEFVARSDHELAQKPTVTIDDVLRAPILLPGEGSGARATALRIFERYGVAPNIALEAENLEMIKAFLLMGKGIALMFPPVVRDELQMGRLKILDVEGLNIFLDVQLVYLASHQLSPSAKQFVEITLSTFASKHA
jgi:DNA-binding transcriptional LysR family regulator